MAVRKVAFVVGEYYHVFNRGVDKRAIFKDKIDLKRFLQSMVEFNVEEPIGSIYENSFRKDQLGGEASKLVEFIAYCLNPNHFHFILTPISDRGVEKFMQRLGTGYTMYFNNKYKRNGALFQGVFKSVHISSNEQLLYVSAYVNLNTEKHQLGSSASKLVLSSWEEYVGKPLGGVEEMCDKEIILGQFKSKKEYEKFARSSLEDMLLRQKHEELVTTGLI